MENAENKQLALDDLAAMVKFGFDDIGERMATKEDLGKLQSEVKEDSGRIRSDLIDYIAK